MIQVKDTLSSFHFVSNKLATEKRLIYTRFGDADIYMLMGRNTQDHSYSPLLAKEIDDAFTISDDNYLKALAVNHPKEKGMMYGFFEPFESNQEMEAFINEKFPRMKNERYSFENPIFLLYLAVYKPALVSNFLNTYIRPKKKMFVGCVKKEAAERLVGKIDYYVNVPPKDAFSTMEQWWSEVEANLDKISLLIPAAGQATRVINKRIWNSGYEIQSFDIGSLIDVTEETGTRRWLRLAGHRAKKVLVSQVKKYSLAQSLRYFLKEAKFQFKLLTS